MAEAREEHKEQGKWVKAQRSRLEDGLPFRAEEPTEPPSAATKTICDYQSLMPNSIHPAHNGGPGAFSYLCPRAGDEGIALFS